MFEGTIEILFGRKFVFYHTKVTDVLLYFYNIFLSNEKNIMVTIYIVLINK